MYGRRSYLINTISVNFSQSTFLIKIVHEDLNIWSMCTPTCRCTYKGGPKIPIGVHLLRHFFHCSKQFLNSWILMYFTASAVFCFTSSPSAKHSSLRTFLSGETKKRRLGWDHVNKGGGEWGHAVFGQKLVNTVQCGLCAPKSPSVKRLNSLKESSKKKIHWSQTQPLTTMPAGALIQMGS